MKIGFIGLGIMGKPMVKNLLSAGHEIVAYDIIEQNVATAVGYGAVASSSPADVARQCGLIITMLPNSPHCKTAILGEGGVLSAANAGSLIIDMSSIAPAASQEIAAECAKKGVRMLDAPVSGGEPKAIDGTLSIMVGGDKEDFDEAYDILMVMGASAVYCGKIGAGNTTKLANQVIVALNIAAVSEALLLSTRAGVNPQTGFEAIRGGLAGSTVMNAKAPMMLERNFMPGFKMDLHMKDLTNALETAHDIGSPLPLTALVMEMMQTLHRDGFGQEDHSALCKYYEKIAGQTIKPN